LVAQTRQSESKQARINKWFKWGKQVKRVWLRVNGENIELHHITRNYGAKSFCLIKGNTFGAYNASDPILTGTPCARNASTSHLPMRFEKVEVLQKSFEELKEARARDKELFEEAKE
ncbi:hypothetical protein Tco_1541768, partial [Tanacetum coccineum]